MTDFVELSDGRRIYVGAKIKTRDGTTAKVERIHIRRRDRSTTDVVFYTEHNRISSYYWNVSVRQTDGSIAFGGSEAMTEYQLDIVSWEHPELTQSGKVKLNVGD